MVSTATAPRLLPAPQSEPPYDDLARLTRRAIGQAPLPLTFLPRVERPLLRAVPAAGRKRPASDSDGQASELQPRWRRTSRADLCDPRPWATRLSRGIAEVLSGARGARQLSSWFTEDALAVLLGSTRRQRGRSRHSASVGAGPRVLVRSVRTCEPADGTCEISIHLRVGDRGRAVAMRAEGRDGRWICTMLQIG